MNITIDIDEVRQASIAAAKVALADTASRAFLAALKAQIEKSILEVLEDEPSIEGGAQKATDFMNGMLERLFGVDGSPGSATEQPIQSEAQVNVETAAPSTTTQPVVAETVNGQAVFVPPPLPFQPMVPSVAGQDTTTCSTSTSSCTTSTGQVPFRPWETASITPMVEPNTPAHSTLPKKVQKPATDPRQLGFTFDEWCVQARFREANIGLPPPAHPAKGYVVRRGGAKRTVGSV